MKKIILTLILLVTISMIDYGQIIRKPHRHFGRGWAKMEQLEKLKLLEILDLDEETSVRFFARKNRHHKTQRKLIEQKDSLLSILNDYVENSERAEKNKIMNLVDEINGIEIQLAQNKKEFIDSLTDILSPEQIAKMVIFESKFRREIADFLIRKRRKK